MKTLTYRLPSSSSVSEVGCEIVERARESYSFANSTSVFMLEQRMIEVEKQFKEYKNEWEKLTMFSSSVDDIINNNPYRNIIGLGWLAVPLILTDLVKTHNYWFYALNSITGDNPIKEAHAGDIHEMIKDWLKWANDKGIC